MKSKDHILNILKPRLLNKYEKEKVYLTLMNSTLVEHKHFTT